MITGEERWRIDDLDDASLMSRPAREGDNPEELVGQSLVVFGGLRANVVEAGIDGDTLWMKLDIID